MTIGIYGIINKVNNLIYIGESNNIERRWDEHIEDLNNNTHHSYKLQNDWNTYGKDNFEFEIIEKIQKLKTSYRTTMQLIYLEGKYMEQYKSLTNGYNVENTMQEILNGNRIIMSKDLDCKYLKKLNLNVKSCITTCQELLDEGYILDFTKTSLHTALKDKNIFYKENNSFYVHKKYIELGYFVNGKESKNKEFKHYKILITGKGKQFIIDTLELKKKNK